ncbi:MAG TPA: aspartate ammonia-lyase [Bacillota bacterium]|nr:aspartate ammonia-lyase [Bacillota bacterium]
MEMDSGNKCCEKKECKARIEKDLIGEKEIPWNVYYGIQSLRGFENFRITGLRLHPALIKGMAMVKKAAALANTELGYIPKEVGAAVVAASDELIDGKLHDQMIVDPIQGGAGTSINMNINEVIANRAIEMLGGKKGDYTIVSPLNHVNRSQSTNDAVPTAARIGILMELDNTTEALAKLAAALEDKAEEFKDVIKMGRTHLQDAVPITLGQEFGAWAGAIRRDVKRIQEAAEALTVINLGGTAVGTTLNADMEYIRISCHELCKISGYPLTTAENLVDATQNADVLAELSSCLKVCAINLCKIANDMRLLASGPMAGIGEIILPAVQPGSSIMPAKVNPVIPEVVNQVAFQIIGNDLTVTMAAQAGQLELNVFMPVLLFNLLQSIDILGNVANTFREKCVTGIKANTEKCRKAVEKNVGIVTALVPYLTYQVSSDIAKEARATGKTVREIVLERGLMTEDELNHIFSPSELTRPLQSRREMIHQGNSNESDD